jgi:hypothetical protein
VGWVSEDGGDSCGVTVDEDESIAVDLVIALPPDGETGNGFLEIQFLRITVPRQAGGEVIGGIGQPCIAGFCGKSLPVIAVLPGLRLIVLRPTGTSPLGVKCFHGRVRSAVWQSSRFCISLL